MEAKPHEILLMGASLGTGNRGVSALSASLIKLVSQNWPEARVSLLIGQRSNEPFVVTRNGVRCEIGVVNFRRSLKAWPGEQVFWWVFLAALYRLVPNQALRRLLKRNRLIRNTVEADMVGDIRGGDSFSDIYGLWNFLWACLPVIAVLLVRGRIVLLPQTYGPFKSVVGKKVAAFILNRASEILCRDKEGLSAAKELAPTAVPARFCPDVAFCLDAAAPSSPCFDPPLDRDQIRCLVGLNVNGLVYNGGYTRSNMFSLKLDYRRFLLDLALALLADPKIHLLLVPHTYAPDDSVESDPFACRTLRNQLPPGLRERVHLVGREYDQNEIKGIIGMCDFFIGSRMHACIAALSQGIPTVGVAYSKKFKGVFETVEMAGAVVDARECDVETALQRTMEIFGRRDELTQLLARTVRQAQETLSNTFRAMLASEDQKRSGKHVDHAAEGRVLATKA